MASNNNDTSSSSSNNISSTSSNDERSRIMSAIQSDLEDVERQLESSSPLPAAGRAVFSSIQSALGSIRSRLEENFNSMLTGDEDVGEQLQQPPPSEGAATTNAASLAAATTAHRDANSARGSGWSIGERLLERLRRAELAHSARIPLDRLQSELSRRHVSSGSISSSSDSSRRESPMQSSKLGGDQPESKARSSCAANATPSPYTPRRASTLLASRRRAEEADGRQVDLNLQWTLSSSSLQASMLDAQGEGMEMCIEESDDVHHNDDADADIPPSILLTKKSLSNLDLARQSVLFPDLKQLDEMELEDTASTASSVVYSWGTGVNSLHDDSKDVAWSEARVSAESRVGRTDIISCAVGEHHAACATATGQVLIAGRNTSGEVDPDRRDQKVIVKPVLLESLNQARIVQVSCGFNHTAALRSNGAVLTWGSNEFGQLGHHNTSETTLGLFCRPAIMALGPGRRATAVACGDGFTLCLTSRMSVLACGVEEITGFGPEESRYLPKPIPALEDLPLVGIAAGRRHAVVLTAHGSAFAWGDNSSGNCGREYPKRLSVPVPIKPPVDSAHTVGTLLPPPLTNWAYQDERAGQKHQVSLPDDFAVVHAACGSDHTVLVTRSGRLLVCGSNSQGQLGLDPSKCDKICNPQPIEHPSPTRHFVRAEAGNVHTLLLDNFGDLWQIGGRNSAAGFRQQLISEEVRSIGAGGEQSVAVTVVPGRCPPKLEFSDTALSNHEELQLKDCVEELIGDLRDDEMAIGDEQARAAIALTKIANSAEELFRTPAVLNSLFMDPTELEDLFTKLLSVDSPSYRQTIVSAIEKGMRKGLESLRSDDPRLMWPEQVRFLLLYIQCPMFVEWKREGSIFDRRGDLILSLCESLLGIPYEGYVALMCWAASVYTKEQFVRLLIRPLLSQLKKGLSFEAGAERRPIPAIVAVLRWFKGASERAGNIVAPEDFYSDAVSNIHPEILYYDLQRFKKATKQERVADFFLCEHPFLFPPTAKRNLLQIESEMNMLTTAASGLTYNAQEQTFEFNPFYVLDVDREHLLTQTLQKISRAEPSDLRKKLRVVFKGEDGVDAGGVTREFFQLLAAQLFDVNSGMWSTRFQDGNITWFNSDCSWNDEGFYLSGILVGLAVYNSVLLDVDFPQAVYRKLLAQPLGLEDMVDEEIKRGLQQLLDYEGDDVEDLFCLTFDVNWVDLGQEKRKELKPNGSNIAVTSDNKEEYVMLYVKWLLVDSIYPQYESFEAGFMRVMENASLDLLLRPEELELLVVGTPELDFDALEKNTEYEGGYSADSDVIRNFWRFVRNASTETQLNLLKFTTGSTRAPIGGLGKMNFKIQRAGPDSGNLPTSHTCFNTLLLPDYGSNYEKLEERLGRAILECEGFGLQ